MSFNQHDYFVLQGCTDKLLEWAKHNILMLAGVALGFAFLQVSKKHYFHCDRYK